MSTPHGAVPVVRGAPVPRLLVAVGLVLEGLAVAAYGVSVVLVALRGAASDRTGAAVLGLTVVVLAAGIVAVAVGVGRGLRWARSPAVVWQLLQLAVAVPAVGSLPWLAVPAIVLAVAVGVGVMFDTVVPRDR